MSAPGAPRFRLRDKLLAAVTVLVVLLVSAVLFTLNERLRTLAQDALNNQLANTLSVFDRVVQERVTSLTAKARLIADDSHLKAAIDVPNPNVATTTDVCMLLNETVREPLFLVTDKRGKVLFDSFHIPEVNLALREGRDPDQSKIKPFPLVFADGWPNVKKALAGGASGGGFIYPLPLENKEGKPVQKAFQTVTVPIHIGGEILGALILGSPLDDDLAQQLKKMTDSEVAVYIGRKVFASTWPEDQKPLVEKSLASAGPGADVPSGKGEAPSSLPLKMAGENYLALFSPFNDTQGKDMGDYAILRSLDKALAPQRNLQYSIVVIGALGVVVAFVLAMLIARRITEPLGSLIKGVQEVAKGNLNARVSVKTQDELVLLADAFNGMIEGLREKERVTSILGKYISPEVAKKVLAGQEGVALRGERRECAILFTDIRGFTALSEKAPPEKIVADLNEYFTLMVDVVIKYEGTLDKFIGDALMAVWGAPIPFEDKELRAVKAALEMQEVLGKFNRARVEKNLTPLTMGVGINTGVVVSGNLGSDKRTDYTVIGEEVNLASRLCSKAVPGQILISEYMYRKLKGLVEVRALDPVALKGFTDPVRVYEVTGLTKA